MKNLFLSLLLLLPLVAMAQYPQSPNKMRQGYQTTALGLTYYSDTIPTHTPSNFMHDAEIVVDTVNDTRWSWTGYSWRLDNTIRRVTPPPSTEVRGGNTLDYRYANWWRDTDSTLYVFNWKDSCWQPKTPYRSDSEPTDEAAIGSSAAVCFTSQLWYETDVDSLRAYTGGAWIAIGSGSGGGGSGSTNLAYTASATDGTVTSDTGTDATIPAGSTTNASLMLPADKTKLDGIESGATADQSGGEIVTAIDAELGNTDWQSGGSGNYVDRDARGDAILDNFSSDSIPNYYVIYDQETDVTAGNEIGGVLWRTSDLNFADGNVLTMIGKYAAAGARSYLEFGSGQNSNVISIHPQDGLMGILTDSPRVSFDINATDAISIPTGITSNRPGAPYFGLLRGNSTTGFLEYYDGGLSSWRNLLARDPDGNLQIDSYDSGTLPNYLIFSDDDIDVATSQFSGGLKWQTSDINRSGVYVNWLENQYISTGAAAQIVLGTDINSNRFSFDTFNGRLGLMTTTPSYTLDIQSSSASILLNPHDNTLLGTEGLLYADDGDNRPKYHNGTSFESLAYLSDLGGGGVTGSGTTNYMPVWSGASALTDSPVYVDGDSLGIGTTSPDASVLHLRSTQTADQSVALLMEVPITANAAYGLGWKESGRTPFFGIQSSNMNTSSGASLQYDYIDKSTPANSSEEILTVFPNRVYINPSSSSTATYGQTLEFGNGKDVIHGFADLRLGSLAGITIEPDRNNNEGDTNWGFRMKPNNASTVTWLLAQNGSMSFSSANPSYTIDAATRTDGFRFAGGTTAQRPVGVNRLMRYNTTWNGFDIHNGTEYLRLLALQDVDPTDGQVPIWSAANSRWEPGTASGGMTSFTLETDDTNPITISDGDELEINGGVGIITTDVAVGEGAVISLDLETMPTNGTPDGDFQFVTYDINGVEESLTDIDEISDYVLNNLPLESTLGLLRQTQATAFELARGTTGERPLATTAFRLRGNTSTSKLEMSNGTDYDNIATEDYVDTEIAGLEPDVSFTSDSDLAIFPNKPVEHVTLETTSGASSDTNLSLPTAGSAYAGYQVVVWSVDLSGSHGNTISATTIQNGATTSGSISLNNYQSTTVSCILVGASTYRWVVTNQY